MADVILKQCIQKLKTGEIFPLLQRWSFLNLRDLDQVEEMLRKKLVKRDIAVKIQEHCNKKGGLTAECAGELDLLYLQQASSKKTWNAYTFSGQCGGKAINGSANQIKKKITKYLRLYFNKDCCVTIMLQNGLLWGRIYLPKKGVKSYQSTHCMYFVHYPQTPVIIINGMRSSYTEFVTQCFVGAFGYKDITDMNLTGHHQRSLAELAINKHSQGGFTRFQRERRLSGPIDDASCRKRKAPEEVLDDRVVDENKGEKRQRLENLDQMFGENVQPTIEKIEYKVELPYRGQEVAQDLKSDGELFIGKVSFHGTSVLEGLRNLAAHGYASVPLPKHLTCVPSRARNYFLLSKPRKNGKHANKALDESEVSKQLDTTETQRSALTDKDIVGVRRSPRSQKKR